MKLQDPGDALWRSLSADWSDVSSRVAWDGKRMKLQDPGKDLLRSLSTDWSHVSLGVTWERARTGESSE